MALLLSYGDLLLSGNVDITKDFLEQDKIKEQEEELIWSQNIRKEDGVLSSLREDIQKGKESGHIPSSGLSVEFQNFSYSSKVLRRTGHHMFSFLVHNLDLYGKIKNKVNPNNEKRRKILRNLTTTIRPGTMTLIMGSPCSGKSSLCSILANQDVNGKLEGEILFGGEAMFKSDHCHRVAYVRDVETHYAHLTVKETFEFAHAMLTPNATAEQREKKVALILSLLGLTHRANTIVGDELNRGVSGGEKRRVTIGVELFKRFQLLVLDEPTTGLDSSTSLNIFQALRVVADEMSPVIATLKQPGQKLFDLFDNIILLHNGYVLYEGPRDYILEYLESNGCEIDHSLSTGDAILTAVDKYGDELADRMKDGPVEDSFHTEEDDTKQVRYKKYSRSWPIQFGWGVKRGAQLLKNFPKIAVGRCLIAVFVALLIGSLFFQLGNSQSAIASTFGCLFVVSMFPSFQALASLPSTFATRPVYYYQMQNRYYHPIPIILSEFVVGIPVILVESVLFSTVCYWMIGLNTIFYRYLYFLLVVMLLEMIFVVIARICSFMLPTFLLCNIVVPPVIYVTCFFTQFGVSKDRAPDIIKWAFYLSPFRYLMEALAINQFNGKEYVCDDDEMTPPTSTRGFDSPFELGGYESNQVCVFTEGEQILLARGFETDYIYTLYWALVMLLFIVILFVIMFFSSFMVYRKVPLRDFKRDYQRKQKTSFWLKRVGACLNPFGIEEIDNEDIQGKRLETNFPVYLEWKNLSYTVKTLPTEGILSKIGNLPIVRNFALQDLTLLHSISGYVKPGMFIAFMGASGAGKTTLLDVLAGRKTAGKIDGEILVNGAPIDLDTLPRFAGYVEQQNIHIMTESVEEALRMSAALRLCSPDGSDVQITQRDRDSHVTWVMDVLSLTELRYLYIEELSLEQKKRLTIGVELAANPSLLFLDEPTSGLDTIAAYNIMEAIRNIAQAGVAVVCTIHQPSKGLFSLFSDLLLLARGGKVIYFGEISSGYEEANAFFAQFDHFIEAGDNPADFFLECSSDINATDNNGRSMADAYTESHVYETLENELEGGLVPRCDYKAPSFFTRLFRNQGYKVESDEIYPPSYRHNYARSIIVQWYYLVCRNGRSWYRSPVSLLVEYSIAVVFGIVLGVLFSDVDNGQTGARETAVLYYFLLTPMSISAMTFIPQLYNERAVLYREMASRTYRAAMYMTSLVFVALPLLTLYGLIVMSLVLVIADLPTSWYQLGIMYSTGILVSMLSYLFALLWCSLMSEQDLGNVVFSVTNLSFSYVSGFVIIQSLIPKYWIWVHYLSYLHYALELFIINGVSELKFRCTEEDVVPIPVPSETTLLRFQPYCAIQTGDDLLDALDMEESNLLFNLGFLIGAVSLLMLSIAVILTKVRHISR